MPIKRLRIPQRFFGQLIPVAPDMNEVVDKVDELVDAVNAGLATSNAIVGGPKFVRYTSSQTFGVGASDLTLDRLDPATVLPGNLATVINSASTPLTVTGPSKGYVASIVPAGTVGAFAVPAYSGAPATDTVLVAWQEVVDNNSFTALLESEINAGKKAYAGLGLRQLLIALVNGIGTGTSTITTQPAVTTAPLAPTGGQVDDAGDTFSFLPNPAYPSFAQYKVNGLPGVTGAVVLDANNSYTQGNRVYVKVVGPVSRGGLAVYVAGSGSVPDGAVLTNADAFTGTGVVTPPTGSTLTAALAISVASIMLGSPLTFTVTAGGGTSPYAYAVVATNNATGATTVLGSSPTGSFTPPATGTYNIDATVTDATGKVVPATTRTVQVNGAAVNQIPVANAGQQLTITLPTSSAALMGSGSDPDAGDSIAGWAWRQVTGPATATGMPAATQNVVVSNLVAGTYQFGLRTTDTHGAQSAESFVVVTVNAATGGGAASFPTQMGLSINSARQASLYPAAAAQDYTYTFTSLPLPGAIVITPPAGAIKLSSVSGVVSDANISEGSISYGTNATTAIQQFLQQGALNATAGNPFNVDWDVAVGTSAALLLDSYTNIYARPGCGAILRPNSNCALFENRNRRFGTGNIVDTDIGFYGPGIWNHNSFTGTTSPTSDSGFNQRHSGADIGWCCPFRFYGVKNFTWNGGQVIRQRTFTFHFINTVDTVLRNGIINAGSNGAALNTDGIHFNGNNTGIVIDNWQINSHDDKIAISVNDSLDRDVRGGNSTYYQGFYDANSVIENFTITNIEFTGGVFGIRIFSAANAVRNGSIKGLYGATGGYWLIMDNFWQSPNFAGSGPGYVSNITFENVFVSNTNSGEGYINECCANINCNATGVTFKNVNRNLFTQSNFPSLLISGVDTFVSNITWNGYQGHDLDNNGFQNSHIVVEDAKVTGLSVTNAKASRLGGASGNALVELAYGNMGVGSLSGLTLDGVQVDGLAKQQWPAGQRHGQ
jgi:hypothetical protein